MNIGSGVCPTHGRQDIVAMGAITCTLECGASGFNDMFAHFGEDPTTDEPDAVEVPRFNPHRSVTADGVLIVPGLWVWTNDCDLARVMSDDAAGSGNSCCAPNGAEHGKAAQMRSGGIWYSDHEAGVNAVDGGCYCRHDHWFTVETAKGTRSFNGERLGTRMPGLGRAEMSADRW